MNKLQYENFLMAANHTPKSIKSRISKLKKVEELFQINIDSIIFDKEQVIKLLYEMKTRGIDSKNQNLSNALRKYYTCMTNDVIDRIF